MGFSSASPGKTSGASRLAGEKTRCGRSFDPRREPTTARNGVSAGFARRKTARTGEWAVGALRKRVETAARDVGGARRRPLLLVRRNFPCQGSAMQTASSDGGPQNFLLETARENFRGAQRAKLSIRAVGAHARRPISVVSLDVLVGRRLETALPGNFLDARRRKRRFRRSPFTPNHSKRRFRLFALAPGDHRSLRAEILQAPNP